MSKINEGSITIYEALVNIRDRKYIMPAFQRQYVWSLEQIEKLWDSILLDYPISTFLFWHMDENNITNDTYVCTFLEEVSFNSRKLSDTTNYELNQADVRISDTAILDGQQRLTSLYLSLFGDSFIRQKHARKNVPGGTRIKLCIELNKDKLTIDEEEYNSKKFDIKFSDKIGKLSPTQFEIRNILKEEFLNDETRNNAIENAISRVPNSSKDYARNILQKLYNKICVEKLIRYTEIKNMYQDDALEMFIRFNNGGKVLKKSDITMSILEAKKEIGELLKDSYSGFGSDFVVRTTLMLYGDVVKSNINKKLVDDLRNNWQYFKASLNKLAELLKEIKVDIKRFTNSWNVLLPIIYLIYYNNNYLENLDGIRVYIIRAILFTYFQSGTTNKLQQMRSHIIENDYQITKEMLNDIQELKVNDGKIDDIINAEKGSRIAGEALYYLSKDWLNNNYFYDQDHLHPFARFESSRPISILPEKWRILRGLSNKLPNLHLLEGRSNESKSDMRLIDYYNDMNELQKKEFISRSLIPEGVSLEIEDFEEFYNKRKELIIINLKNILN